MDDSTSSPEGGRMAITRGKVLSVNVGSPREFEYNGRPARSAIWKSPVAGRVAARGVNLAGDDQADRRAHGGPRSQPDPGRPGSGADDHQRRS